MNLYYGSRGDDVKKLQEALSGKGYKLNPDGIFGSQTANALKQYQKANGLSADGIFGEKTSASLYGAQTPQKPQQQTQQPDKPGAMGGRGDTDDPGKFSGVPPAWKNSQNYKPSQNVQKLQQQYQTMLGEKPDPYKSALEPQIQALMNQILNRDPFSYNAAEDPMYLAMRDRYVQQGQQAMMDAMGQTAAMTGGNSSSSSQAVGQQAYQQYLMGLNDQVPGLARLAMDQYNLEGDQLAQKYGALTAAEQQQYGRYNDDYERWLQEVNRLYNEGLTADEIEFNRWQAMLGNDQWERQFAEDRRRWEAQWQAQQAAQAGKEPGGGRPGGYRGGYVPANPQDPENPQQDPNQEPKPKEPETGVSSEKVNRFIGLMKGQPGNTKSKVIEMLDKPNDFTDDEIAYIMQAFGITVKDIDIFNAQQMAQGKGHAQAYLN